MEPDGVELPEPDQPLAPSARAFWAVEAGAVAVPAVFGALALGAVLPSPLTWLVPVVALVGAVVAVGVVPALRVRRFRWALREEELDLRHGVLSTRRTTVPVARIDHVETQRGFVAQTFDLAALVVHTAAGSVTVPALPIVQAEGLRDRIARLARVPDDTSA